MWGLGRSIIKLVREIAQIPSLHVLYTSILSALFRR